MASSEITRVAASPFHGNDSSEWDILPLDVEVSVRWEMCLRSNVYDLGMKKSAVLFMMASSERCLPPARLSGTFVISRLSFVLALHGTGF